MGAGGIVVKVITEEDIAVGEEYFIVVHFAIHEDLL